MSVIGVETLRIFRIINTSGTRVNEVSFVKCNAKNMWWQVVASLMEAEYGWCAKLEIYRAKYNRAFWARAVGDLYTSAFVLPGVILAITHHQT